MRRAALSLLGAARWLVVVLPPAAYRGLVRTLVATGHRLMAAGQRGLAGSGERRASRGARSRYGSDLDRPGDRLARGCCCAGSRCACLSGAGAIQHGLRRIGKRRRTEGQYGWYALAFHQLHVLSSQMFGQRGEDS